MGYACFLHVCHFALSRIRVFIGVEKGLLTTLLLPPPPAYVDECLATGYGRSLDLAGIHVATSDHLLGFRQLRGIMALVVLLVHIESVDPALLFYLLQLEVPKDLLSDKCRYQLHYLCCFHSLLTTSSSIIHCPLNKGNLFSPPLPAHQNAN